MTIILKKLILCVHLDRASDGDYGFDTADYAVVGLTPALIARIRQLSMAARALAVPKIPDFNNPCDFMTADEEQEWENGKVPMKEFEKGTEFETLNVTDSGFYWSGYYKHTRILWFTDTVPLAALDNASDYDLREVAGQEVVNG